jgi:hypothetical protein
MSKPSLLIPPGVILVTAAARGRGKDPVPQPVAEGRLVQTGLNAAVGIDQGVLVRVGRRAPHSPHGPGSLLQHTLPWPHDAGLQDAGVELNLRR